MAKRFTETDIWEEDWFIEMPVEYKLFYFYLKDQCNYAGIWRPNIRIFEAINEVKIDLKKAIEFFNTEKQRIQILNSGHWLIVDFFVFQYGSTFNKCNRVHESIENIYNKEDIKLTSIRGLKEVKDRPKEKEKDIDKEIGKKEEKPTKKDFDYSFISSDWLPLFTEWVNYKKSRNEMYKTQDSLKACYRNLLKLSNNNLNKGREVIDQATGNNWAGLFPLKGGADQEEPFKLSIITGQQSK